MTEDETGKIVADYASKVHPALGPGLPESACGFYPRHEITERVADRSNAVSYVRMRERHERL
jgi:hypothetical protein